MMILAGAFLLAKFHWILYVFGAFLLLTGIKMIAGRRHEAPDLEQNPVLRWLTQAHADDPRVTRASAAVDPRRRASGCTPRCFIVIVMIGITDVIFAVDSIPAIFAITDRPLHRAHHRTCSQMLGLRAMFFLLPGWPTASTSSTYGLALVLMFIGVKMLLIDVYKIPIVALAGHRGRDHRHHHRPEPAASAAAGTLTARSVPSMQAPPTRAVLAFERSRPSSMACPRH
jgi:tellurite resistance protein TerC